MISLAKQFEFNLTPFDIDNLNLVEITGSISRFNNYLNIKYLMSGNLSRVSIPKDKTLSRQYDLWEHTCFEFFLKPKNTTKYWEFNLSPSGAWNIFRFNNYRGHITEERAFNSLFFDVFLEKDSLQLNLKLDLDKLNVANKDLDVAISTVIESSNEKLSYWALTHPGIEADFHHQDSFIINLN